MTESAPALALLAELESAGALSTTGWQLARPDLPFSQYEALCVFLGRAHEAVRFAIGDTIIQGEKLYGQKAYQAIELMGLSENARLEYVRVAERVPRSVRRDDLSWSHHRAVATKPIPEQRRLLKEAAERGLSHHELRAELRSEEPQERNCPCCHRPLSE